MKKAPQAKATKRKIAPASEEPPSAPENGSFPIIGIGASAGGLEALEQFLAHVPEGSGLAFVVVQHLDPDHKGMMAELLQRKTSMPVHQIRDRMRVEADHVYMIPPNKDLAILHGTLHLSAPAAPRGLRRPIDFFFRSLADDRQERSVGVILSGMASDGTLGLRAIKEKAGVAFVQDPASAKFDGMPRSVLDAGLADIVASAEELPAKILEYLRHVPLLAKSGLVLDPKAQSSLEKIALLLRGRTGHDFSLYKKSTLYRRIERRMGIHQINRIAEYVRYLRENSAEVDLLFKELLIGVTQFFRDPPEWERLKAEVLPTVLASRPSVGTLRVWVVGCSTGEEAYSLAILFQEALEELRPERAFALQIFATDLDRDAIDRARLGVYGANIAADVSAERLRRFFVEEENGYRVGKAIREMVIFAVQNVIMDPPFTKLDLLACRNLLIYLEPELQKKLLPLFHYSLNPGGTLFLGSAESVGGFTDLFASAGGKSKLFRKSEMSTQGIPVAFPSSFVPPSSNQGREAPASKPPLNLEALTEKLLLQRYTPAAVLVSGDGDILYVSGRTGKYLEPAAGKANWNVFAMAREGLRYELAGAFQRAHREGGSVTLRGVQVGTNGGTQTVNLTVQALDEPGALQGLLLIVFADVAAEPKGDKTAKRSHKGAAESAEVAALRREIQELREELQTTREEMQSSQEELKSANEELQSTNEELQSTNEELTTSKEEMQSMNEELQTLNAELQAKVDELSRADSDMKNLLNSTDIATVFLDGQLNVRRFTPRATGIIKLLPSDAGRPLTDIASVLAYPELVEDAREVLRTLVFREKQVPTQDGRWFLTRIMPYRTSEDRIDGVVITFSDISAAKTLEAELRREHREAKGEIAEGATALAKTTELLRQERDGTSDFGEPAPVVREPAAKKP